MKQVFLFFISLVFCLNTGFSQEKVLFIGNSYTYYNDMPIMFNDLSTSLGHSVQVSAKTNGGFTFQDHYNDPATFTAINQDDWDVVVLQGQSQEPSFAVSQVNTNTYPYAKRIADSIYNSSSCTNLMYYVTWGRQNGDSQWDSINTFDKMNARLYNAYMRFADSSDAMVSPVAIAWKSIRDNYPSINLYNADQSHPSIYGSYLVACTMYAAIFQQTPVGATYTGGLTQSMATILQTAAANAVLPNQELYNLHSVHVRTVADFEWSIDETGLLTATSASLNETELDWYIDGTHYTGNEVSHQFSLHGTYEVQLIATSACNSDTLEQVVNYSDVSIEEAELSNIVLYPNPSNGEIHFSDVAGNTVNVYDLNGKLLLSRELINGSADVRVLKDGTYLVESNNVFYRIRIQK